METKNPVGGPTYADGEVGRENTLEIVPEDVVGTIPGNSGTIVLRVVVYVVAPENVTADFAMFVFAMLYHKRVPLVLYTGVIDVMGNEYVSPPPEIV